MTSRFAVEGLTHEVLCQKCGLLGHRRYFKNAIKLAKAHKELKGGILWPYKGHLHIINTVKWGIDKIKEGKKVRK